MASLAKRVLNSFIAATMFAASTMAFAEENSVNTATKSESAAATNQNVSTASASVSCTAQPQQRPQFIFTDARDNTEEFSTLASRLSSADRVTVIIWGGSPDMQREVFQATQEFMNNGNKVGLVIAQDRNGYSEDAEIEIYSLGHRRTSWDQGENNMGSIKGDVIDSLNEYAPGSSKAIACNPN